MSSFLPTIPDPKARQPSKAGANIRSGLLKMAIIGALPQQSDYSSSNPFLSEQALFVQSSIQIFRYNNATSSNLSHFDIPMKHAILYALDFDGVICDSAVETAVTGWKAAGQIWNDMPKTVAAEMIDRFRLVRPIIETGYEAILAMRLIHLGETTEAIYSGYSAKTRLLLEEARVSTDDLKKLFGETRDAWIAEDLDDWIAMNPLFPDIADKLRKLGQQHDWYVITTKQERFVKHILKANTIDLADERIFGLDRNLSKSEVLTQLSKTHPHKTIHFVEDRLPTLINVKKHPELTGVKLYFAPWGYNTPEDKALAAQHTFITQPLEEFLI